MRSKTGKENKEKIRTAVVTGASRGIGRAIAKLLAENGFRVALISRNKTDLDKVIKTLKNQDLHNAYLCDVRERNQVIETFQRINSDFGRIDILVNNAGINSRQTVKLGSKQDMQKRLEANHKGWDNELTTNLTGTYLCSYVASMHMDSGSIINISSVKAKETTSSPGYGASKAGVEKLTKDLAKALSKKIIRVNCIAPGFIDTGLTAELSDEKKQHYMSLIPMKRFGRPSEIASVVMFLVSKQSSYITGTIIHVNGGYYM